MCFIVFCFPTLCRAEQRHGTEVIAIQANFAYGAQVFEEIEETISAYQVGILGDLNSFTLKVLWSDLLWEAWMWRCVCMFSCLSHSIYYIAYLYAYVWRVDLLTAFVLGFHTPLCFSEQCLHHIQLSKVLHWTFHSGKLELERGLDVSSATSVCICACVFMWSDDAAAWDECNAGQCHSDTLYCACICWTDCIPEWLEKLILSLHSCTLADMNLFRCVVD